VKGQLGWSDDDGFLNTVSVSAWFPTVRYDASFAPNAGKNHYGIGGAWSFNPIKCKPTTRPMPAAEKSVHDRWKPTEMTIRAVADA
jgi:hypothetical protein